MKRYRLPTVWAVCVFTVYACGGLSTSSPTFAPTATVVARTATSVPTLIPATDTPLPTPIPPTKTATRIEWTATPEVKPRNFVELTDVIVKEFLQAKGLGSLEKELEKHDLLVLKKSEDTPFPAYPHNIFFGGFRKEIRCWEMNGTWLNLGAGQLSLENVPGAHQGDFALVMVGARPKSEADPGGLAMPFIVAVKWQGQSALTPNLWYDKRLRHINPKTGESIEGPVVPGEKIFFYEPIPGVDTPEDLERYINEHSGWLADIIAYIRFQKERDWMGVHFDPQATYGLYKDASLPIKLLMDALKGGYIQRFTRDPKQIGKPIQLASGQSKGEWASIKHLYDLLDPNEDYGLFVGGLALGK